MLRRTLPEGCLSSLALDQKLIGELDPERRQTVRAHLDGCAACRGRLEVLHAERRRFTAQAPRRRQTAPVRRMRLSVPLGAAARAAAALLLVLVRPDDGRDRAPDVDATRAKGSLRLEVYVKQGDQVLPARGAIVRPGDAIRFAYAGVDDGYLAVLGRDGAGVVSLYYPQTDRAAAARRADQEELLPGSIVLDDSPGPETIYLVHCAAPVPVAALVVALDRSGLPAMAGCAVDRLELEKRP